MNELSRRVAAAQSAFAPIADFYLRSRYAERRFAKDVSDFTFGNPQEMPLPAYVDALQRHAEPRDKDWFAYKLSEPASQRTVAETLTARTGLAWRWSASTYAGSGISCGLPTAKFATSGS